MKLMKVLSIIFTVIVVVVSSACSKKKASKAELLSKTDTISYVLGVNLAKDFKSQSIDINVDALFKGVNDAMQGAGILFTDSQQVKIVNAFNRELQVKFEQKLKIIADENKRKGAIYMAENKKNPGVVELPDGLQFRVIREGAGASPKMTDNVEIHYRLSLIDGTIVDDSYNRGAVAVKLDQLSKGLSEGIQMMKQGSIYEFYIPSNLGYGDVGVQNAIPGGATLIYQVELFKIN